jgi:uncharacterized membrane protein
MDIISVAVFLLISLVVFSLLYFKTNMASKNYRLASLTI